MKILREPDARLIKEYRNNYTAHSENLRPLSFLVRIKEDDDTEIIYNILTGGAVRLSAEEFESEEKYLSDNLYLVPGDFDEYAFVDDLRFYYSLKNRSKSVINNYFIYPTTGCNARCFYCFEEGIAPRVMSDETALKTAEYITENSKGKPVRIKWFGGEPSMCMPTIKLISEKLHENGVSFTSKMNTNGYLADEEMIRNLYEICMLRIVQIPVDGVGEDYDTIKNYVDVPKNLSPWDKIVTNIGLFLDAGIQVDIRLNIGNHNKEKIPGILDELIGKFKDRKNFRIFPQVLNEGKYDFYSEEERAELFEIQKKAYVKCLEAGITIAQNRYSLPAFSLHSCFADDSAWVGISPEGRIYKCPENINNELYFSELGSSARDEEKIDMFYEKSSWERCKSCAFYPSCVNLKECIARQRECEECHRDFRLWKTERILRAIP